MLVGVDLGTREVTAALMDGDRVRSTATQPTTPSFTGGVAEVLRELVETVPSAASVRAVTIGTTRFEDAMSAAAGLTRTGCIRLCAEDESVPPLAGWPARHRAAIGDHVFRCAGGHEFDGTALARLDVGELDRIADSLAAARVGTVAITSVFSPVDSQTELAAAGRLRDRLPDVHLCLSHEIGSIGLLERENATIVNAALLPLADELAEALTEEVAAALPRAAVYLAQNDGTAMELSFARRYPVFTFRARRTSAVRGGALLSGHTDCVVVDIGTETTTVAVLSDGYPRLARQEVSLAGIGTSLRMAEALRMPFGSHSVVSDGNPPAIGPGSAEPLVHGGVEPTITDLAAVRDSRSHALDPGFVRRGLAAFTTRIEQAVLASGQAGTLPVVLVGSGAAAVPTTITAHRPAQGGLARAAGTASTRVGGEVDRIVSGDAATRASAVEAATSLAAQKAVMAGAAEDTIRIVEAKEFPLAYLPGEFVRLTVRAVGDLG